jgi:hypothetical protein
MTFRRVQRGRWHSYELDGQRIPGVTTMIGKGVPKPNLIDWAARIAAEYAADHIDEISPLERDAAVDLIKNAHTRSRNTAAAKGTEIHALAVRLRAGEPVEIPETIAGYVDAYLRFLDDWQPETIAVETPCCNRRWRYAGSFDELCRIAGLLGILDIKTGGSGVWPETCLQIAAYRNAEIILDADGREQPMPATDAGWALWLGDDGAYELLPVESGPDIFAVFLHACHVAAFMERAKDDLIGLPLAAPAKAS